MISVEKADEIAKLYYEDVYYLCLVRLRNEENASDVTQEVFLCFQEHCDILEDTYIKSWLYSVANKKIKEQFRKIAKKEKEILLGNKADVFTSSAEMIYEMEIDNLITDEEIEKKKDSIIESLNKKELELFEMLYIKRLEYDEIARSLEISSNAAKARAFRLNNKLKRRVNQAFMAILLIFMKL